MDTVRRVGGEGLAWGRVGWLLVAYCWGWLLGAGLVLAVSEYKKLAGNAAINAVVSSKFFLSPSKSANGPTW